MFRRLFGIGKSREKRESEIVDKFIASIELPPPVITLPEPSPPITVDSPACPYCGVIQEPSPTRRKKCADCGEVIFPKTDPETRIRRLFTRTQALDWDRQKRDKVWRELNETVIAAYESGQSRDFHRAKMAHFQQALMLFKGGREHHTIAGASRKDEILHHKANAVNLRYTTVEVVAQRDVACGPCQELHGRQYTFAEALKQMPIPVRACETWPDKNPHGGWCRCYYKPVL